MNMPILLRLNQIKHLFISCYLLFIVFAIRFSRYLNCFIASPVFYFWYKITLLDANLKYSLHFLSLETKALFRLPQDYLLLLILVILFRNVIFIFQFLNFYALIYLLKNCLYHLGFCKESFHPLNFRSFWNFSIITNNYCSFYTIARLFIFEFQVYSFSIFD